MIVSVRIQPLGNLKKRRLGSRSLCDSCTVYDKNCLVLLAGTWPKNQMRDGDRIRW